MQSEIILGIINDFLHKKSKKSVVLTDRLHSSGILSSIEMFELVLNLEQLGWKIPRGNDLNIPMGKIDLVSSLCGCVQGKNDF